MKTSINNLIETKRTTIMIATCILVLASAAVSMTIVLRGSNQDSSRNERNSEYGEMTVAEYMQMQEAQQMGLTPEQLAMMPAEAQQYYAGAGGGQQQNYGNNRQGYNYQQQQPQNNNYYGNGQQAYGNYGGYYGGTGYSNAGSGYNNGGGADYTSGWYDQQARYDEVFDDYSDNTLGYQDYTDASGNQYELYSGYNSAWVDQTGGTYIQSTDYGYDPNTAYSSSSYSSSSSYEALTPEE